MSKYDELKAVAEEVQMNAAGTWTLQTGCSWRRIGTEFGDGNVLRPCAHQHDGWPDLSAAPYVLEYLIAAQPAAILELITENERLREQCELNDMVHGTKGRERLAALFAEYGRMADQVSALEEKVTELNFDAARYCYLATTTWSDEVTDALCTSDKDQIDQAVDAELMRDAA